MIQIGFKYAKKDKKVKKNDIENDAILNSEESSDKTDEETKLKILVLQLMKSL